MKDKLTIIATFLIMLITIILANYFGGKMNRDKIVKKVVKVYPFDKNFIEQDEVAGLINLNDSLKSVEYYEKELEKNSFIDKAEVYKDLNNNFVAEVYQYNPIARFINRASYYIDKNGKKLPLSIHCTEKVVLFFGEINKENKNNVVLVATTIRNNKILNEIISEVHLHNNNNIIKVKGIKVDFIFGKLNSIQEKFEKIIAITTYLKKHNKQNKYYQIDLRYNGQIVCKKTK